MIHTIKIDDDIDQKIHEFNLRNSDRKITDIKISESYLFIVTEEMEAKTTIHNLLLEEIKARGKNR